MTVAGVEVGLLLSLMQGIRADSFGKVKGFIRRRGPQKLLGDEEASCTRNQYKSNRMFDEILSIKDIRVSFTIGRHSMERT